MVFLGIAAPSAFALDNVKTAVAMVQSAAKAYEAGEFSQAAEQYAKAWRLDPRPDYLWALARAEHLAALFAGSAEHYRMFIALPGADAARVLKARQYLRDAEMELVRSQAGTGDAAMRAGKPELAAEHFLGAFAIDPSRVDLLFKAAVAEQVADLGQLALQHLDAYLERSPVDAPDRAQALARRASLRTKLGLDIAERRVVAPAELPSALTAIAQGPDKVMPPEPVRATPVATAMERAPVGASWSKWAFVGVGAALFTGGAILLILAQPDADAITAAQAHAPGQLISTVTYSDAESRVSSINARIGVGWGLLGTGVACAGFGTWLLLRGDGARSAVLPTGNGAVWLVKF